ncbi:anthranilate synthase component II [Pajaroellobacter abortibovis]|uniref:Anthranilate/aminodeoxychorismate synthase component II n=1 Tax=Pajaroellobacter abortibovis TaxID=1882918 RepID=A0A1L6MX53_9BACT|nr:aminodeoxychorismate/anthranilate synthase component II [Pajaroellobacter abortibovis]APS00127.1 anthranilate/aminodeoxychorismate synthase component II [Pajaroellobacter abortibovis]
MDTPVSILCIDHYDSFTFNIVQLFSEALAHVEVIANDAITIEEIQARHPDGLLLSPGPGTPEEARTTLEVISKFAGSIPILGVCFGHQAIGHVFGAQIVQANRPMHGKTSPVIHDGQTIFQSISSPFEAMRYHSLIVSRSLLPACLEVSAWTQEGEIMGLRHRTWNLEGVQFHPESILTQEGGTLMQNWIRHLSSTSSRIAS